MLNPHCDCLDEGSETEISTQKNLLMIHMVKVRAGFANASNILEPKWCETEYAASMREDYARDRLRIVLIIL